MISYNDKVADSLTQNSQFSGVGAAIDYCNLLDVRRTFTSAFGKKNSLNVFMKLENTF